MNQFSRNLLIWSLIVVGMWIFYNSVKPNSMSDSKEVSYSEFLSEVDTRAIEGVEIVGNVLVGVMSDGSKMQAYAPYDPELVKELRAKKIDIRVRKKEEPSILVTLLLNMLPFLLIIAVWVFFMRQMQGGKGGAMSFGKSRATMLTENQMRVTFDDVAGIEEAKQELEEVVDFLKDPGKYQRLGGKIPKGVLLVGQPGTGKTLLARSVAGEAGVPFFTISGSDFVEMFVGVGASRVRDLFEQGKKKAPCIIFIDEIDAVGRHRGAGVGGGNDEREQTLNQLLVEMDGFESTEGVILIAATNRPDVLDPALLRPGRFDRQVVVPLPDIKGREAILDVHMQKVPLSSDVESDILARGTPGFSGADLANLVNEAALMAARNGKRLVDMEDFEMAKDKVMMGAERRSAVLTTDQQRTTAYHEAGHAIVTLFIEGEADPLHKVTIIPRGRALGVTMSLPEEDKVTYSKVYLENQIAILMGGRLAEELVLDQKTTGASNDIERATDLARSMVCSWGMSDELGPQTFGAKESDPFLGRSMGSGTQNSLSTATAEKVDSEVNKIIDTHYKRAEKLLKKHDKNLHTLAEALLEYETLDKGQIDDLLAGKKVTASKVSRRRKKIEDEKKAKVAVRAEKEAAKSAKKDAIKKGAKKTAPKTDKKK